jgi:multicomponent Na+:H+ antiporter subunit B
LFLLAAALLAAPAVAGLDGLPALGHYVGPYGDVVNAIGVPLRHVTNMVTAVNYDIRGFDTLGEEFILFAAVAGVVMLLREARAETTRTRPAKVMHRRREGRSEALTLTARCVAPATLSFGAYVVLHAQITPGGGFQGGVIIFAATLLVYFSEGYAAWRKLIDARVLAVIEALGAAIYLAAGLAPLALGKAYLQNILPLGATGSIVAGGLIPPINLGVALAVSAGFCSVAVEFLEETREVPRGAAKADAAGAAQTDRAA